ncbi:MAG: hypothetical protein HY854_24245 [Burkholderiales bacterium]|nr:hypothetical protein [Burkholderiales bacterium]
MTPVRELVDLPLRLREEFFICEDDIDAKAYSGIVATGRCAEALLGQVIQGVLDELAFHGGPHEQAAFSVELKARVDEVKAGAASLIPAEEIFFRACDQARFVALFETLGGVPPSHVRRAIRQMEDDEPAGPFFERTFNARVCVKPQFWDRRGREFRKAFRAAGR